jgi:hypothetical protein
MKIGIHTIECAESNRLTPLAAQVGKKHAIEIIIGIIPRTGFLELFQPCYHRFRGVEDRLPNPPIPVTIPLKEVTPFQLSGFRVDNGYIDVLAVETYQRCIGIQERVARFLFEILRIPLLLILNTFVFDDYAMIYVVRFECLQEFESLGVAGGGEKLWPDE